MAVKKDISRSVIHNGLLWQNIIKPTEKTTQALSKKYKFHHLDLEDCLSKIQRPKIDDYEKYLFIVLHFPYYDKATDSIMQDEIDVFVGSNYIITLSPGNKVMEKIFDKVKRSKKLKDKFMGETSGYLLYKIIDEMFAACFPLLDNITAEIDELESGVFELEKPRDMLKEILSTKKDIISYRRIIIPQRTLIAQLEHKNKKFLPENLDVYFDDVVDKIEKIFNNLESLWDIIASLHETNESILSHNTNNIIKILTIFSVIMLPLTFVTGFYGMNITGLPVAEHPLAFFVIGGILILIVLVMLVFFRFKKWI
jgi:magnesium transporter